jgi:hypothetical protein
MKFKEWNIEKMNEELAKFGNPEVLYVEDGVRNKIMVPLAYLQRALDNEGKISIDIIKKCVKSLEELEEWVKELRRKREFEL